MPTLAPVNVLEISRITDLPGTPATSSTADMLSLISTQVPAYLSGQIPVEGLPPLEGRVQLREQIGRGSLGSVFKGFLANSGLQVAVKVISMAKLRMSGVRESAVQREIATLMNVSHPSFVKLVDVLTERRQLNIPGTSPPYLCIVMEHAPGRPLSLIMRQRGPNPGLARAILPQLAGALQEMHGKGFCHRDMWSENVLVDDQARIKIIDLGCACSFARGPNVENRMNVPYMSPQASVGERQNPGDDAWALGVVIAEVISGEFIAEIMGRNDIPLHAAPHAMQALMSKSALGGQDIQDVVAGLLQPNAQARLKMMDVLQMVSGEETPLSQADMGSVSSNASTGLPLGLVTIGHGASAHHVLTDRQPTHLVPGMQVIYLARTHNQEYKGVVIEGVLGQGVLIQLDAGGEKLISDKELWRLRPLAAGSSQPAVIPLTPGTLRR
eukprot:TRINITY_DN17713_c0_g1_i12.p1 TRINITY_DN17713_c0_g1~~TRINITY_DN17713_c0_g1_i12.p1  ORF type:complete len:441 (-),score=66.12 TRINITY_DN17713_c0_g1_i12:256-1578(-)